MSDKDTNKLENGKPYSITEIFCGKEDNAKKNRKIIIPDLQRDYCWGNTKTQDSDLFISELFVKSLIDLADTGSDEINMGMIYAYESPKHHIQLCDGQQRLTTIYLLSGMLYKKTKQKDIKEILISEYELKEDDKEPRLLYAIRESTLYFLSDLVCNFFLEENSISAKDIENQSWYYREYDYDPSIVSIIEALKTIEKQLNDDNTDKLIDPIIKKIRLFYFDMQDRYRGEDMFVIINTTGEPLTPTENLKPILIGNIIDEKERETYSKQWEERETWFWKNKLETEHEADDGLNDFLGWVLRSEKIKEEIDLVKDFKGESIRLETIQDYFINLKELIKNLSESDKIRDLFNSIREKESLEGKNDEKYYLKFLRGEKNKNGLNDEQINNVLIPLLSFMVNVSCDINLIYQFMRRLRKNYFDMNLVYRKGNYVDWRYILKIIQNNKSKKDIISLLRSGKVEDIHNVKNNNTEKWYNSEEQKKDELFPDRFSWKITEEKDLWKWEDHPDFVGDISPLITLSESSKDQKNNIEDFFNIYYLFIKEDSKPSEYLPMELYNLFNLIIIPDLFRHDGWEWYQKNKNQYRLHLNRSLYPFFRKIKETCWSIDNNYDAIAKEIKQIIKYVLFMDLQSDTWDYSFDKYYEKSIKDEDFIKLLDTIDANYSKIEKLRFILLLMQTIYDIENNVKTKIVNYNDWKTINFELLSYDNEQNVKKELGNIIVWSRWWGCSYTPGNDFAARKNHYLYDYRLKDFSYYKDLIKNKDSWTETDIQKTRSEILEKIKNFLS